MLQGKVLRMDYADHVDHGEFELRGGRVRCIEALPVIKALPRIEVLQYCLPIAYYT